jgi:hypothetical protein
MTTMDDATLRAILDGLRHGPVHITADRCSGDSRAVNAFCDLIRAAPAIAEKVLRLSKELAFSEAKHRVVLRAANAHLAAEDAFSESCRTADADVPAACARADAARECLAGLAGYVASDSHCYVTTSRLGAAEVPRLRAEGLAVGNLLAVIHRDGGHHMAEHGVKASCAAAERVVCDERARLDAVEHAARAYRDATDVLIGAWAVRDATRAEHWIAADRSRREAAEAQAAARAALDRVIGGGR